MTYLPVPALLLSRHKGIQVVLGKVCQGLHREAEDFRPLCPSQERGGRGGVVGGEGRGGGGVGGVWLLVGKGEAGVG